MMIKKRWLVLLVSLGAILLANSMGTTRASFVDQETSSGNSFTAWTSTLWTQTTQADFQAGVLNNVDTSSSPGDVKLSLALITSDNTEVSVEGTTSTLVKTLTFIKSGASYNELRIDSNLRIDSTSGKKIAYSEIKVDDVTKFTHNTTSAAYVSCQDILDFSLYADGTHTVKLYLYTNNTARTAYNSTFELYRTKTFVSSGTIASQVLDSSVDGSRWDALFWDETLPSNTDITFEVRASDTLFLKGDATPSWDSSVWGTSPVTSGLPSGRYKQWRATLTTSDNSQTPTLQEGRVYYYA